MTNLNFLPLKVIIKYFFITFLIFLSLLKQGMSDDFSLDTIRKMNKVMDIDFDENLYHNKVVFVNLDGQTYSSDNKDFYKKTANQYGYFLVENSLMQREDTGVTSLPSDLNDKYKWIFGRNFYGPNELHYVPSPVYAYKILDFLKTQNLNSNITLYDGRLKIDEVKYIKMFIDHLGIPLSKGCDNDSELAYYVHDYHSHFRGVTLLHPEIVDLTKRQASYSIKENYQHEEIIAEVIDRIIGIYAESYQRHKDRHEDYNEYISPYKTNGKLYYELVQSISTDFSTLFSDQLIKNRQQDETDEDFTKRLLVSDLHQKYFGAPIPIVLLNVLKDGFDHEDDFNLAFRNSIPLFEKIDQLLNTKD